MLATAWTAPNEGFCIKQLLDRLRQEYSEDYASTAAYKHLIELSTKYGEYYRTNLIILSGKLLLNYDLERMTFCS